MQSESAFSISRISGPNSCFILALTSSLACAQVAKQVDQQAARICTVLHALLHAEHAIQLFAPTHPHPPASTRTGPQCSFRSLGFVTTSLLTCLGVQVEGHRAGPPLRREQAYAHLPAIKFWEPGCEKSPMPSFAAASCRLGALARALETFAST